MVVPAPPVTETSFWVKTAWALDTQLGCPAPQVVVALLPLPVVVHEQVQLSYALMIKLPCRFTGAWVEIGAGGTSGGFRLTSICTMRLEPGFCPIFGVTASEVISHTG